MYNKRFQMLQRYIGISRRKTSFYLERKMLLTEEMKHYDEVLEYL